MQEAFLKRNNMRIAFTKEYKKEDKQREKNKGVTGQTRHDAVETILSEKHSTQCKGSHHSHA